MVSKIPQYNQPLHSIRPLQDVSHIGHHYQPCFSDELSSAKETTHKGIFGKLVTLFNWVSEKLKWLYLRLFCCKESLNPSTVKLNYFKSELAKIEKLIPQFSNKARDCEKKAFKQWWGTQFKTLGQDIQEMLLIEYVKDRKEAKEQSNEEKWAYDKLEEFRRLATFFVVNLSKEMGTYDPKKEMPRLLENLRDALKVQVISLQVS